MAQDLTFHAPEPDHDEELYQMMQRGEVRDSLTVAAVLKVKLMVLEGRIRRSDDQGIR